MKTMDRVLAFLVAHPADAYSAHDLAGSIGISFNAVKGALQRLLTSGRVHKSRGTRVTWSAAPATSVTTPPPAHHPPVYGDMPSA